MKTKQIEKLLKGKMNKFIASITDSEIQTIFMNRSYITGGCIPTMLMDGRINDFDIYLELEDDAKKVFEYYKKTKEEEKEIDPKLLSFYVKLITENSINLSDQIQIILKFTGKPEKVIPKFDFAHIQSYFHCNLMKLYMDKDTYRLCMEKEIIYTGSDYPLSSLFRIEKYIKKGWTVSKTTLTHIALDIVLAFGDQREVEPDIEEQHENWVGDPFTAFSKEELIQQLNGVDPLTIQARLLKETRNYLTIAEIINLMNDE